MRSAAVDSMLREDMQSPGIYKHKKKPAVSRQRPSSSQRQRNTVRSEKVNSFPFNWLQKGVISKRVLKGGWKDQKGKTRKGTNQHCTGYTWPACRPNN
jgi:hypothetical protein